MLPKVSFRRNIYKHCKLNLHYERRILRNKKSFLVFCLDTRKVFVKLFLMKLSLFSNCECCLWTTPLGAIKGFLNSNFADSNWIIYESCHAWGWTFSVLWQSFFTKKIHYMSSYKSCVKSEVLNFSQVYGWRLNSSSESFSF